MTNGFCKFDCKLYQRGCAGNSDGYIKNCKEYDPEPPYYLISPQDLEIIYRGDSDSSSESYEETRKHPYDLQAELETVLEYLDIELEAIKSRIESSAMGQPLSERSRGEIIGLLHAREKIKCLRKKAGEP